jgi:ABC-type Fe3+/spermidine/putrescine transport system ATPase subunit
MLITAPGPHHGTPMSSTAPVLQLQDVSRSFARGEIRAVDGVSLDIAPGEIVSILGPSGCGKTTLMRMIAGLEAPSGGDIRIYGQSVRGRPPHRRNIGLVLQSLAVFPHMSVRQNVSFGLRMRRFRKSDIDEKVDRVLDVVQLPAGDFAHRFPHELSGGQLQRVALARTLVTEPALVLFDEPMAALDRRLRDHMAGELRSIQRKLGIAAVYVTHDQETASAMSDRIAIMRDGRIVQVGTPAGVYERPASRFVAEFLGDANFLAPQSIGVRDGRFRAVDVAGTTLRLVDGEAEDADGTGAPPVIMFRPEHTELRLQPADGFHLKGVLVSGQFRSGAWRWQIRLSDGQTLMASAPRDVLAGTEPGGEVWMSVPPENARLLRQ